MAQTKPILIDIIKSVDFKILKTKEFTWWDDWKNLSHQTHDAIIALLSNCLTYSNHQFWVMIGQK